MVRGRKLIVYSKNKRTQIKKKTEHQIGNDTHKAKFIFDWVYKTKRP